MINLINRILCKIQGHEIDPERMEQCEYTGQEYVYCVSCNSFLPVHNLD
jgi:hypothetical protein